MKRSTFLKNLLLVPIALQLPNLVTAKVVKLSKLQKMLLYGQIQGRFDFIYDFPAMSGNIPKTCTAVWKDNDLWVDLFHGSTYFSITSICIHKGYGQHFTERYYSGMLKSTQISKLPDYHIDIPINKEASIGNFIKL